MIALFPFISIPSLIITAGGEILNYDAGLLDIKHFVIDSNVSRNTNCLYG